MKTHLSLLALVSLLSGCTSPLLRPLSDTLASAGGAALGSTLTHNSTAGAAGGAAGGLLLSESFFQLKSRSEQKAFHSGYQQALADQVKAEFWRQQLQHLPAPSSLIQVPIPLPERMSPDGVRLVPSTQLIPIHP